MRTELAREIRAEMGREQINATRLAHETGISVSSIKRKVINTCRTLNVDELSHIAAALGVPASELLRRAETAQKH